MGRSAASDLPSEQKTESTASTPTPRDHPPRSWHDEENPFVAFRRYADEQISSVLQSVMGLPSIVTPPFPDKWASFADERNYDQSRQRNGDHTDLNDRDTRSADDDWNDWQHSWNGRGRGWSNRDEFEQWRAHSQRPFDFCGFDSFLDDRSPFGFGRFSSFHPFFSENFFGGGNSQAWPIPYILFSPYSPLHLERSRARGNTHGGVFSSLFSSLKTTSEPDGLEPRWREAFEDLVRLENGQPMLDRSPGSDSKKETGNEWLRGLVQRGSLGSNWKLIAGPNDNSPCSIALEKTGQHENGTSVTPPNVRDRRDSDESEHKEAETELDLYDRFLQDIVNAHERDYARAFSESPLMRLLYDERKRHLDQWGQKRQQWEKHDGKREKWLEHAVSEERSVSENKSSADQSNFEPLVVSTMTRTERNTLPDGSLQTKIVKTRRFTDGREERDESVEVVPPSNGNSQTSDNNKPDDKSNGGWFWRG